MLNFLPLSTLDVTHVPGPPRFTVLSSDDEKLGVGLGTRLGTCSVYPVASVCINSFEISYTSVHKIVHVYTCIHIVHMYICTHCTLYILYTCTVHIYGNYTAVLVSACFSK